MFIGHFAVGFAAKRAAPRTSLGWLIAAPMALDLIWPIFVLRGWERVRIEPGATAFSPLNFEWYPWSHSLLMAVVWSALAAGIYQLFARYPRGAAVIGLGVVSHWFLDAIVHRPDLPLTPGGSLHIGLGLWNSVEGTVVVETLMFAAGLWLYLSRSKARDHTGTYPFVTFVLFTAGAYASTAAGPPPLNPQTVAAVAMAAWVFPFWAWWFDAHRTYSPPG